MTFTQLRSRKGPSPYSWASPVPTRGSRDGAGSLSEPRRSPLRHLPRPGERRRSLTAPRAVGTQGRSKPRPGRSGPRARVRRRARELPGKDTRGWRCLLSVLLQTGTSLPEQRPRPAPLPPPRTTPASPSPAATGSPPPGPQLRAAFAALARSPRHGPRPLRGREAPSAPPALRAALTDRLAGTSTRARPTPLPPPPRTRYGPVPRGTPGNVVSGRGRSAERGRGGTARGGPWTSPRGTSTGSGGVRHASTAPGMR